MPAVGNDMEQVRRLDHAVAKHGFRVLTCPQCDGDGCSSCGDPDGVVFQLGDLTPCGPDCPMHDLRPS